jgi:WD40 repeat protein
VAGIGGGEGNTDLRLQFTRGSGKHLLFACSTLNGYELWVDGQKWPGVYTSGTGSAGVGDPLVSPDGEHLAYVVQISRDKSALLLDGKDTGYMADNLQFTADSKHLVGLGHGADGTSLLIDGKPVVKARGVNGLYLSPAGNRIIAVLQHQDPKTRTIGQFLWVDGKPVEASLCQTIKKVVFSPDGKRYAALCGRTGAEWMVVDGKKGQEYQLIAEGDATAPLAGPRFSSDSSKFGYGGHANGKAFVVIDDEKSDAFYSDGDFIFSPDSKHVVMSGRSWGGGDWQRQVPVLIIDDKTQPLLPNAGVTLFTFSPDGSRYAYVAGNVVVVDGKSTGIVGLFSFSPDSKHVCITGSRAADNKAGLFLDGQLVFVPVRSDINYRAFTPDGQHLFWMDHEAATGAAAGTYQFVTYVDGQAVARADESPKASTILMPTGFGSFTKTIPAWSVGSDGTLTCLAPSGDAIKRIQVTPGSGTSVAALVSSAAAQPQPSPAAGQR